MSDDSNETTNTDAAILADFRCRLEAEFRGVGIERVRGVVPGGEPGASRVLVVRKRRCGGRPPPQQVAEADAVR